MLDGQGNFGFDAARKEYVDLVEAGIVDPAKVVRTALENAVSVASVLLLTEATMTEIPERSGSGRPSRRWQCNLRYQPPRRQTIVRDCVERLSRESWAQRPELRVVVPARQLRFSCNRA